MVYFKKKSTQNKEIGRALSKKQSKRKESKEKKELIIFLSCLFVCLLT